MITFHSVDSDGNKVIFTENYKREDNKIIFNDKSAANTRIEMTINDDMSILFERKGDINMLLPLAMGEMKAGYYSSNAGLSFDLNVRTTVLQITANKITVEYDLHVMDLCQHHKLWILIH